MKVIDRISGDMDNGKMPFDIYLDKLDHNILTEFFLLH